MTPDEIKAHPVFAKLTENQQKFVVALIETKNDKVAAAYRAWKPKSDGSARSMASQALQDERIAYLVESYFGTDPERVKFTRETALQFAAQKARNASDDKLALDYLKIIAEMEGWRTKPAENTPEGKDSVWDEVARLEAGT